MKRFRSILIVPITNDAGRNTGGETALTTLAARTGGRVFAATLGNALDAAFAGDGQAVAFQRDQRMVRVGQENHVVDAEFSQDLRADALRVAASRQVSQGGQWVDAPVQAATVQKLEEVILTKARDLRRNAL